MLLIVVLAILGALNTYLPQGAVGGLAVDQRLPASKPAMAAATAGIMLSVYGGLGYVGLLLARRLGFPEIWDPAIPQRLKFLAPALVGAEVGLFFIVADRMFQRWHGLGPLPHPPFPTSLVASATAGIGEEVIFRLFLVPVWMSLLALILPGRSAKGLFWIAAGISAVAFAAAHVPAIMALWGLSRVGDMSLALLAEILLLNGVVSMAAAIYFRRYGFLAAVGVHFWADVVWHVVWGALSG
jgi:hypothetical protein